MLIKRNGTAIAVIMVLVLLLFGVVGCGKDQAPTENGNETQVSEDKKGEGEQEAKVEPIKIAHAAVLSGGLASLGEGGNRALNIWAEQLNDSGGLLGRPVEIINYDSQANPSKAVENVKKAVLEDSVDFIITTDSSGVVMGITPLGNDLKIPIIHATGGADNFQNVVTRYVFRVSDTATVFSYAAAKYLSENYPEVETWAGINPDYEWGHSAWESFQKQMKKFNPNVRFVTELWPGFGEKDFKPYITQLQASDAEGLFTSLWSGDEITLIKQGEMVKLFDKFDVFMDGSSTNFEVAFALEDQMVETVGNAYYYFEGSDPTGANEKFVKLWKEKHGENDVPNSSAGSTYSAAQVLAEAVIKAGTTEALPVIEALEGLEITTIMGKLFVREYDHQGIREKLPMGEAMPDSRYPFWTWGKYSEIAIPQDLMPESDYKGWEANQ